MTKRRFQFFQDARRQTRCVVRRLKVVEEKGELVAAKSGDDIRLPRMQLCRRRATLVNN